MSRCSASRRSAFDVGTDALQSLQTPSPVIENGFAADHKCAF